MEKHIVALVPLKSYDDQSAVDAAVREGIDLIGGLKQYISPEEKILLKPNLLGRAQAHRAVTTHPAVFEAVGRLVLSEGFRQVTFGDSPGNPTSTPESVAESCGINAAAKRLGIPWGNFSEGVTVQFTEGKTARSFHLCKGIRDADAIINICKMKTHALERITGAVKNMYGAILGLNKGKGHVAYPNSIVFADMLCDLHRLTKPRLHIMDGVMAMEGNGPNSGVPTPMNVLLFSADPVALDSVFASLVYLDPALVPTCVSGQREGIGVMDSDRITVRTPDGDLTVAEAAAKYGKESFDVFRGEGLKKGTSSFINLLPFMQDRPQADPDKCIACGICEEACPVPEKAVHSGNGKKAQYDYKRCIHCFCCQEMCPAKAITVYRHPLARLLGKK